MKKTEELERISEKLDDILLDLDDYELSGNVGEYYYRQTKALTAKAGNMVDRLINQINEENRIHLSTSVCKNKQGNNPIKTKYRH